MALNTIMRYAHYLHKTFLLRITREHFSTRHYTKSYDDLYMLRINVLIVLSLFTAVTTVSLRFLRWDEERTSSYPSMSMKCQKNHKFLQSISNYFFITSVNFIELRSIKNEGQSIKLLFLSKKCFQIKLTILYKIYKT